MASPRPASESYGAGAFRRRRCRAPCGRGGDGRSRGSRSRALGTRADGNDNDGRVDVAVNSIGGPLLLFRNTSRGGHWLDVALARFAPGARVTVDGVTQEVHAGSSYLSSEDPRLHFGLGGKTRVAELTVAWPGGKITRMRNVRADRIVEVKP